MNASPFSDLQSASAHAAEDQKYVFDTFGKRVLDNAWNGYHCCLFAYGQTGLAFGPGLLGLLDVGDGLLAVDPVKVLERATQWLDTATTRELCRSPARRFSAVSQRTMATAIPMRQGAARP